MLKKSPNRTAIDYTINLFNEMRGCLGVEVSSLNVHKDQSVLLGHILASPSWSSSSSIVCYLLCGHLVKGGNIPGVPGVLLLPLAIFRAVLQEVASITKVSQK